MASTKGKSRQWSILSIQDAFKLKLNVSDVFKFIAKDILQIGSHNPGDRRKTNTVNSNNRNAAEGQFVKTRLTPDEMAALREDMADSDAIYAEKLLQMVGE